ncbi:malate synthase G [Acetobacter nitrogenifigens DSM 23921 = NBRC 105050]|uniref:Malate synthase G n=1 Tax=Acetobacter nitrogenifigens DSM 23921 = NBRC 105050 TaxID=1120919 RepID=A0A511X8A4_9PROT|nr:malate synthase G [Acetobacter nitrogenifigens]GBQ89502.1 malate synthase G [Acetobacter nitrogenifigens DSM 23921 = NBRC 105050]GEN59159.1 malate synthase G [Acetobacter nitrogenifigens DSM 23921 = NBRC 105050]
MTTRIEIGSISVDQGLHAFINTEVLPGTDVSAAEFWSGLAGLVETFGPKIREALDARDQLQDKIDAFLGENPNAEADSQIGFLREIGYIEREPNDFTVSTDSLDDEIGRVAGPQLVVPVNNARYALNAANARWGSLYDAFYGTDALSQSAPLTPGKAYNELRGRAVVQRVRLFLDETTPLLFGSHVDVTSYYVRHGELHAKLECGRTTGLRSPTQFAGFAGEAGEPTAVLLRNHGLHIELRFDRTSAVGKTDKAGVADVILESALTTIMDCEDSVSAVDAEDKVHVYRNWLGLMRGELTADVPRGDKVVTRRLAADRTYIGTDGAPFTLPGRSLLLARTVGHHMTTDAVLDSGLDEAPEGVIDAAVLALIGLHDLRSERATRNSRAGSIYIVRPKMHGSQEVALSDGVFAAIEDMLSLPRNTIKMGVMDEERRTSVNLAACLHAARERVVFINTGFLDRTGDEIHTCMKAGPVVRKGDMKTTAWIKAYEQRNVAIGIKSGLTVGPDGHGQIGKGMWAMPDRMEDMLEQKGAQLRAGACTAWVPSPTAATLHALHYHEVDVAAAQRELRHAPAAPLSELLTLPLAGGRSWSEMEIAHELDTNLQSILGYVVRWVDLGVGCSKVPDMNNVGLMEDRATLRISAQHVANWLMHGVVSQEQVDSAFTRMARIVDQQNEGEPGYRPLTANAEGPAFMAAKDLVFRGAEQPNGYTEAILHRRRREAKRRDALEATSREDVGFAAG